MKKLTVIILCFLVVLPLGAQSAKDKKRQARYKEEIAAIQKELKAVEASGKDAVAQLQLIEADMSLREQALKELVGRIDSVSVAISAKEAAIDSLETRYDDLLSHFNALVKVAYRSRSSHAWLLYVLSGSSPAEVVRRGIMLRRMSDSLKADAVKVRDAREQIRLQNDSLVLMKGELEADIAQRKAEAEDLRTRRADVEVLMAKLRKDKAAYEASLKQKQSELAALEKEMARVVAATTTRPSSGGTSSGSSSSAGTGRAVDNAADAGLASSFEKNKGKLPWPVKGTICETFGTHKDPVTGATYNINGVELVTAASATVTAVFDGVVEKVTYMDKYYNLVIIRHGSYYTMYCKLGTVSVKAGDKIKTGQTIGTVVTAGGQTRFHFEIWKGGSSGSQALNPSVWMKR